MTLVESDPNVPFSIAILLYRPASQSLHSWWILTFFSQHCFSCAVMFGAVDLLSHKLIIDEIVFWSSCCYWSTNTTFGLLSCFLMSPISIIMLSTKEKCFQINLWCLTCFIRNNTFRVTKFL